MEGDLGGDLTEIWSERAQPREEDAREELNRRSRLETRRQQAEQDKETDTALLFAAVEIATAALQRRIKLLGERLDALDRASLEALEESRRRLEEIRTNANRANDGRRVYEAADGTIYDEEGSEVGRDEIDPDAWNPAAPGWENYTGADRARDEAQEIRDTVLEQKQRLKDDPDEQDLDEIENAVDALDERLVSHLKASEHLSGGWQGESTETFDSLRVSAAAALDGGWNAGRAISPAFRDAAGGTPDARPQGHEPDSPAPMPAPT